jgi:hypothetical protein
VQAVVDDLETMLQKQVQRWLKAAGPHTPPRHITGLEGRRYRGPGLSAPDGDTNATKDAAAFRESMSEVWASAAELHRLGQAAKAEFFALRKARVHVRPLGKALHPWQVPVRVRVVRLAPGAPAALPRFWQYVKHGACHWLVNFGLRLAMLAAPARRSTTPGTIPRRIDAPEAPSTLLGLCGVAAR